MSINQTRTHRTSGIGLVELLIVCGLASLVVAAIVTLFTSSNTQMVRMFHYCDLNGSSELALDCLTRDIRNANRVTDYTGHSLQLEDANGVKLTYTYNEAQGTLTRDKGPSSNVLLRGCDSLVFTLAKRDPAGKFETFPPASSAECKVVSVTWKCSRTLLGRKAITENVTTANIVIRRQGA